MENPTQQTLAQNATAQNTSRVEAAAPKKRNKLVYIPIVLVIFAIVGVLANMHGKVKKAEAEAKIKTTPTAQSVNDIIPMVSIIDNAKSKSIVVKHSQDSTGTAWQVSKDDRQLSGGNSVSGNGSLYGVMDDSLRQSRQNMGQIKNDHYQESQQPGTEFYESKN